MGILCFLNRTVEKCWPTSKELDFLEIIVYSSLIRKERWLSRNHYKEGKQGGKVDLCQITQELDLKSVAADLIEVFYWGLIWIQIEIIGCHWYILDSDQERGTTSSSWHRTEQKPATIQRRAFNVHQETIPENYLKKFQESLKESSSSVYPCMFGYVWIHFCTRSSFFQQNIKKWRMAQNAYISYSQPICITQVHHGLKNIRVECFSPCFYMKGDYSSSNMSSLVKFRIVCAILGQIPLFAVE